tara:strand:- start:42 stop:422 length:381 start_codon:yes stop_codon:yes gene_type:complete
MEIPVTKEHKAKTNDLYHFIFHSRFVPQFALKYYAKKSVSSKELGTVGIIEKLFVDEQGLIHIYIRVIKNPFPVAVLIYAISGFGLLAILGLTLKQVNLVVAEGVPNVIAYGVGGYILILLAGKFL